MRAFQSVSSLGFEITRKDSQALGKCRCVRPYGCSGPRLNSMGTKSRQTYSPLASWVAFRIHPTRLRIKPRTGGAAASDMGRTALQVKTSTKVRAQLPLPARAEYRGDWKRVVVPPRSFAAAPIFHANDRPPSPQVLHYAAPDVRSRGQRFLIGEPQLNSSSIPSIAANSDLFLEFCIAASIRQSAT